MSVPSFRLSASGRLALLILPVFFFGGLTAHLQGQATINASIEGGPEISREWLALALPGEDGVGGTALVAFTYSGPFTFSNIERTFRLAWRIDALDPTLGWVPQAVAGGGAVHYSAPFVIARSTFSLAPAAPYFANVPLAVPPSEPTVYRLTLSVERLEGGIWVSVAGPLTGTDRLVYPFLNTHPSDAARNMWTRLTSFSASRQWALETATNVNQRGFHFVTQAEALRFDAFNVAGVPQTVSVRYRFRLFQEGSPDTEIPLMQSTFQRNHSIWTHEGGEPRISNLNGNFYLRPAQQLNSPTGFFRVEVEIEHDEEPGGPIRVSDPGQVANLRLLHFNGTLRFGTVDTVMRTIGGNPSSGAAHTAAHVQTVLDSYTGFLSQNTSHTVASASSATIRLFSDGRAQVFSTASPAAVTPPSTPDRGEVAGIRFERNNINLSTVGARADLRVRLPQGMGIGGFVGDRLLESWLDLGNNLFLTSDLQPADSYYLYDRGGASFWVFEETKPVGTETTQLEWTVADARFDAFSVDSHHYVRAEHVAKLQAAPLPFDERNKPSNEGYFAGLNSTPTATGFTWRLGASGGAEMSGEYTFGPVDFRTHFPYKTRIISNLGGEMVLQDDRVTAGGLYQVDVLRVVYRADCDDADCLDAGDPADNRFLAVQTFADQVTFTADGGLMGAGVLIGTPEQRSLRWGGAPGAPGHYAQETDAFDEGVFVMAGTFMPGAMTPSAEAGLDALHHAGHIPANESPNFEPELVLPGSTAFFAGAGHYAGINVRVATGGLGAQAKIAGTPVPYILSPCAQFYVRPGGVSGKVEVVPGSFPSLLTLQGYLFNFTFYGVGYTDSRMRPDASIVTGGIDLVGPSAFVLEFDLLTFTCTGELDELFLPTSPYPVVLGYWLADIDIHSARFVTTDACLPGAKASLLLGVSAYSTLIDTPLIGSIGIRANGELISREFSQTAEYEEEITSRLRPPSNFTLTGPADERYRLVAVSEAYFNDFASAQDQNFGAGRLNVAAKMDVPFFEDLETHIQTTARRNTDPGATAHVTGGWTAGTDSTFFNTAFFDANNVGFPGGVSWAIYRGQGDDDASLPYLVRARQSWLGVVNFNYPLRWRNALRSFESWEPVNNELLIVEIDHEVVYLSAENAELKFGVKYDGLPSINLSNFVFNAIEDQTGALSAFLNSLAAPVFSYLNEGVDSMSDLLADQADAILEAVINEIENGIIDPLFDQLLVVANGAADATAWANDIVAEIQNARDEVENALANIAGAVGEADSIITQIDNLLLQVEGGIAAVADRFVIREGEVVRIQNPAELLPGEDELLGLLFREDTASEFQILQSLVGLLLDQISAELGGNLASVIGGILDGPIDELNDIINEQIQKAKPTLDRLVEVLHQVADLVGQARQATALAGQITAEIQSVVGAATEEIERVGNAFEEALQTYLAQVILHPTEFVEGMREEVTAFVRREITDLFAASKIIREVQLVLRQHLYDVETRMREGIDTVFAEVNKVARNLLGEFLAEIDNEINGLLGDINGVLGAAQFDGYAHINGDALRLLRIDAAIEFKVPDEFQFKGYFQIKQLESDGTGSCSMGTPGNPANEVTVGALGIPVQWLDSSIRMDIEGKFTFSNKPLGMGGRVEMTEGEISFQAFTITKFGAAMAFGKTENYLAAKLGMKFQDYQMAGGIFFGRTCTIEPLRMINEDVADVLGEPNPTFSGGYVYGEVWLPISEMLLGIPASCMFRINAGVGAGAFFFVEGPTYGGQMFLGVSGEALCVVSIKGEVSLIGVMVGSDLRFSGRGRLSGEVGACPFCIKFNKTARVKFENKSWSVDL